MSKLRLNRSIANYIPFFSQQSKAAGILYFYLLVLAEDEEENACPSYNDMRRSLGMSNDTISRCKQLLQELGLVHFLEGERYVLLEAKELSEIQLKRLYEKYEMDYSVRGKVQTLTLDERKKQLTNRTLLAALAQEMGLREFKASNVLKELRLAREDLTKVEFEDFRQAFLSVVEKLSKTKPLHFQALAEMAQGLSDDYSKYGAKEIMLYFLKRHQEVIGYEYAVRTAGATSIEQLKEYTDCDSVLKFFGDNACHCIEYIEWAFKHKASSLSRGINTGILAHPSLVNEFRQFAQKGRKKVSSGLPAEFVQWLEGFCSTHSQFAFVKRREDLIWMQKALKTGDLPEGGEEILREAKKVGIL